MVRSIRGRMQHFALLRMTSAVVGRLGAAMRGFARMSGWSLCGLLVLALVSRSSAQKADGIFGSSQTGTLTVWIVTHNPNPRARNRVAAGAAPAVPQYQEKTMAEFGQTAGSVGQTAGSVGQTAGSFGDTASSTGQTAGSTGQTAGSFGTNASSVGKNAGDAGQTVGSFGVSSTDLPAAAAAANALRTGAVKRDPRWDGFLQTLQKQFNQLQVRSEDVYDDELPARLEAVAGTAGAPDALLGSPLPAGWSRSDGSAIGRYGMVSRLAAVYHPQTENDVPVRRQGFAPEAAVLAVGGRGPLAARAMYLWLADGGEQNFYRAETPDSVAAVSVALGALRSALGGGDASLQIDATDGHVRGSFAVFSLRALSLGEREFGVGHGLAVLQKDQAGRWAVLQLSTDLTPAMRNTAFTILQDATQGRAESNPLGNEGTKPLGIRQAAPLNGDTRGAQPELWWDNLGGASLQVVEWSGGGTGTNLFFVRDNGSRLRTRVIARFATGGTYRWRVWSVGVDGAVVLSPWRTLNVVGR